MNDVKLLPLPPNTEVLIGWEASNRVRKWARACIEADRKDRWDGGEAVAEVVHHNGLTYGRLHGPQPIGTKLYTHPVPDDEWLDIARSILATTLAQQPAADKPNFAGFTAREIAEAFGVDPDAVARLMAPEAKEKNDR